MNYLLKSALLLAALSLPLMAASPEGSAIPSHENCHKHKHQHKKKNHKTYTKEEVENEISQITKSLQERVNKFRSMNVSFIDEVENHEKIINIEIETLKKENPIYVGKHIENAHKHLEILENLSENKVLPQDIDKKPMSMDESFKNEVNNHKQIINIEIATINKDNPMYIGKHIENARKHLKILENLIKKSERPLKMRDKASPKNHENLDHGKIAEPEKSAE